MKTWMTGLLAALAVAGMSGGAAAQEMRPQLTLDNASTIRDACLAFADERDMVIAVAVYDDAGRLMTFAAMDGLATAIADVAMWKGKSAATYRFTSEETANWGGAAPGLAVWGGGVPFAMADETPLGGVGVSGADTQDDIDCAEAGIAAAGLTPRGTDGGQQD